MFSNTEGALLIPRYSRPEMAQVWSDERKYGSWLQVEIAVCEAWSEQGVIPKEALEKIRNASIDIERIAEYEAEQHHDFNSFLASVADSLGEESRFVHLGLTSYDAEDTALSLRLVDAATLLERDVAALLEAVERRALRRISSTQPASFSPKVVGSAWTPCERPMQSVSLNSTARCSKMANSSSMSRSSSVAASTSRKPSAVSSAS